MHGDVKGKFTEASVRASLETVHDFKLIWQSYFDGFGKTLAILEKTDPMKSVYYFLENPKLDSLPKDVVVRPFDHWGLSTQDNYMDL